MSSTVRTILWIVVAFQAVFAAAFFFQLDLATSIWPYPETGPLTFTFIASIFLAAAAATGWCLYANERAALTGIGLDYVAIFIPLTVASLSQGLAGGEGTTTGMGVMTYGLATLVGIFGGLWLTWYGLQVDFVDRRPTPLAIRAAFVVFIVALIISGSLLVIGHSPVVPWLVTPELALLIGLIFIGAAVYFAYGLFRPVRGNAHGQLASFLAYDVVLLGPFLVRVPTIDPALLPNLVIYIGVLVVSAALAIYYLFIEPRRAPATATA